MNVRIEACPDFHYLPPDSARSAKKILIKPNLGYPFEHPVTIDLNVLSAVLTSLKNCNPRAEILIVEGVCSEHSLDEIAHSLKVTNLLDNQVRLLDADALPLKEYPNLAPAPVQYASLLAPALLDEVDCRISLAALKRTQSTTPLISASLKNLFGLFPRSRYSRTKPHARDALHHPSTMQVLQDIFFTIGHLFDGAVVGGELRFQSDDWRPYEGKSLPFGKVVYGDDLIAVDRAACLTVNEVIPPYVENIDKIRFATS